MDPVESGLTAVEKSAQAISEANMAELNAMEQVGDIRGGKLPEGGEAESAAASQWSDSDEEEFCKIFGLKSCDCTQKAAIERAKRLAEAGPTVAIAALILGMTNLPD